MEKSAALDIDTYMPAAPTGLEKYKIACSQFAFTDTLAKLHLKLGRARQYHTQLGLECQLNKTGAVDTILAHAANSIPGMFPLIVLLIQHFLHQRDIFQVYLGSGCMSNSGCRSNFCALFRYAAASDQSDGQRDNHEPDAFFHSTSQFQVIVFPCDIPQGL